MKKLSILTFLIFITLIYFISIRQALLAVVGIGYGIFLIKFTFGFTTGWRNFIEKKDSEGIQGQFLLIGMLFMLSAPLIVYFPQLSPASASISVVLLIGSFSFGLLMQLANGCGSGTLYKAGGLNQFNLFVLLGFIAGAFWGTLHLKFWFSLGTIAPAFNLLRDLNPVIGIGLQLSLIVLIWLAFAKLSTNPKPFSVRSKWFKGAVALALLASLNLILAGQSWGIVYGLGLWGAKFASLVGWDPLTSGYWQQPYQLSALKNSLLIDTTSITNLGILFGAWSYSKYQNKSNQTPPTKTGSMKGNIKGNLEARVHIILKSLFIPLVLGVLLGYSSRLAFGCNIGAFVSGISTGGFSGWVWFIFAFGGSVVGVKIRRKYSHLLLY